MKQKISEQEALIDKMPLSEMYQKLCKPGRAFVFPNKTKCFNVTVQLSLRAWTISKTRTKNQEPKPRTKTKNQELRTKNKNQEPKPRTKTKN